MPWLKARLELSHIAARPPIPQPGPRRGPPCVPDRCKEHATAAGGPRVPGLGVALAAPSAAVAPPAMQAAGRLAADDGSWFQPLLGHHRELKMPGGLRPVPDERQAGAQYVLRT